MPCDSPPESTELEALGRQLLGALGEDPDREGLRDTPARWARAWAELTAGYRQDPGALLTSFDADGYDEMVLLRHVPFYSLCEHHLLPFHGHAHVAYLPAGRIVGVSKLARLVECYSRRLQNQERITAQVADALEEHLQPGGVGVVLEATHLCLCMRGAQRYGSVMVTSALRGALRENPESRAEAMSLLRSG